MLAQHRVLIRAAGIDRSVKSVGPSAGGLPNLVAGNVSVGAAARNLSTIAHPKWTDNCPWGADEYGPVRGTLMFCPGRNAISRLWTDELDLWIRRSVMVNVA
jgi:hypothetical protein